MLLPWVFRTDAPTWRASGFYISPNHFAGMLELMAIMAASMAVWSRWKSWARILSGYVTVLCVLGIAISGSRGSYLSTTFALAVFAALSLHVARKVYRRRFVAATVITVLVLTIFLSVTVTLMSNSDIIRHRMGQVYEPENMRVYLWQAALKQFRLNPMFGTGSGTYLYFGRMFRAHVVQNDPIHVHDDYLELLAEYGVAGVVLFAAFLLIHIARGMKAVNRIALEMTRALETQSYSLALTLGALSAASAYLIHSVVDFNMHIPANALIMAFLFGILGTSDPDVSAKQTRPLASLFPRLFAGVCAIPILAWSWHEIPAEYYAERARIALRDYMPSEAVGFAEKGLLYSQKNYNLHYYRGEAKHLLGIENPDEAQKGELFDSAIESFRQDLELFPQDLRTVLRLAALLDKLRNYDEAEKMLNHAVELDPNFGNVYAYYGLHYQLQDMPKEAWRLYTKALKLGPNPIAMEGLPRVEKELELLGEDISELQNEVK
jgi:O-antigen ligase